MYRSLMWYWERHWRSIFALVAKLMLFRTDTNAVCAYVRRMPKFARLWIVFAVAALFIGYVVSPTSGIGVIGGLAFFLWTDRPVRHRWKDGGIAIAILMCTLIASRLAQDYLGGNWAGTLLWWFAAFMFAEGVKWVATPRPPKPPQG